MTALKLLLLRALENLGQDDFDTFKWHLNTEFSDRWKPIAVCHLESASRTQAVNEMVRQYGEESAVSLAVEVLRLMNNNEAAQLLASACKGGKPPAASATSSAAAPAVTAAPPATISAQDGAVVNTPTIIGSTIGSMTVHITQNK